MKKFNNMRRLISEARKDLEIPQMELSNRLGYKNGQFISNVERGLCSVPAKKFHVIAQILNLSVKELIKATTKDLEQNLIAEVSQQVKENDLWVDSETGYIKEKGM
jgi:transcriptional regulator with XRE-family HTH domain